MFALSRQILASAGPGLAQLWCQSVVTAQTFVLLSSLQDEGKQHEDSVATAGEERKEGRILTSPLY